MGDLNNHDISDSLELARRSLEVLNNHDNIDSLELASEVWGI